MNSILKELGFKCEALGSGEFRVISEVHGLFILKIISEVGSLDGYCSNPTDEYGCVQNSYVAITIWSDETNTHDQINEVLRHLLRRFWQYVSGFTKTHSQSELDFDVIQFQGARK